MDLAPIGFAISESEGNSERANVSSIINLCPEFESQGSKTNMLLVGTEGYERGGDPLVGDILGIYEFQDIIYIVTNEKLYSLQSGTITLLGNTFFSEDRVFIADNGTEIMFVGHQGYAYNPGTSTLTDMTGKPGWYNASTVTYMDGYFIFNRAGTGQFFISKLYSIDIDPLDWATGEAAPDDTKAVIVAGRQLWIMGERSTEVWYDSGDPLFPFTRISGAVTDVGIISHNTIAKIHTTVLFVGNDFRVYATNGYTPTPISNIPIDLLIKANGSDGLMATTYFNTGHYFYVLHIGEDNTVVYDLMTGLWHSRKSHIEGDTPVEFSTYDPDIDINCDLDLDCFTVGEPALIYGRWGMIGTLNIYGDTRIIGYNKNVYYFLSTDILSEDGINITRSATSMPLNKTPNFVTIAEIQVDMDAGGYEPILNTGEKIWLQSSKDNGHTWSNRIESKIGLYGKYQNRARWQRLGQFRDAIVRVIITDPIKVRLLGLWVRS